MRRVLLPVHHPGTSCPHTPSCTSLLLPPPGYTSLIIPSEEATSSLQSVARWSREVTWALTPRTAWVR